MKLRNDFENITEFENAMSEELLLLWHEFQEVSANGFDYTDLEIWLNTFEPYGLTFEYGLSAEAYDFKLK